MTEVAKFNRETKEDEFVFLNFFWMEVLTPSDGTPDNIK